MTNEEYMHATLEAIVDACDLQQGETLPPHRLVKSVRDMAKTALDEVGARQVPGKDQGAPQEGSGATGEDTGLLARVKGLEARLDALEGSRRTPAAPPDPYEYRTTDGPRKAWDGEPDLSKEGWEEYQEWERFDYHEERYWRRLKPEHDQPTTLEVRAARWIGSARSVMERVVKFGGFLRDNVGPMYGGDQVMRKLVGDCRELLDDDWLNPKDWDEEIQG